MLVDGFAHSPMSMEEFSILPGVKSTIEKLKNSGFLIFVVTNQPEISRGKLDSSIVESMNLIIKNELNVDEIKVCPHDKSDGCTCRKPLPGMIEELCKKWSIDKSSSWVIGDRWVDILSAKEAGLKSVLLEREYSWKTSSNEYPPINLEANFAMVQIEELLSIVLGNLP